MKPARLELAALARAVGVQRTPQEIETLKLLQSMTVNGAQIDATPADVKAERCAEALAAVKLRTDAEAVRAAMWAGMPLRVRRMVCAIGGMQKGRADDELRKFDALERGTIYAAMDTVIRDLEKAKRCMVGGEMPAPKPAFGHVEDQRGETLQ